MLQSHTLFFENSIQNIKFIISESLECPLGGVDIFYYIGQEGGDNFEYIFKSIDNKLFEKKILKNNKIYEFVLFNEKEIISETSINGDTLKLIEFFPNTQKLKKKYEKTFSLSRNQEHGEFIEYDLNEHVINKSTYFAGELNGEETITDGSKSITNIYLHGILLLEYKFVNNENYKFDNFMEEITLCKNQEELELKENNSNICESIKKKTETSGIDIGNYVYDFISIEHDIYIFDEKNRFKLKYIKQELYEHKKEEYIIAENNFVKKNKIKYNNTLITKHDEFTVIQRKKGNELHTEINEIGINKIKYCVYLTNELYNISDANIFYINGKIIEICKECVICLQSVNDYSILSCSHIFHEHCIEEWQNTCPVCKQEPHNIEYYE